MTWLAKRGVGKDVFFVGAGFSIAAFGSFPDTNTLGRRVLELDDSDFGGFGRNQEFSAAVTFENWLTRLAEKQPYDSEEDRFRRASYFARAQSLVARVLDECLQDAMDRGLPEWLYSFAEVLHINRSTVITLNYDTLIEQAIDGARLYSRPGDTRADADRALKYMQIPVGSWSSLSPRTTKTVDLYKLHGSVDWFWVPGDITGTSLTRQRQGGRVAQAQVAGRSRYIVPPTTTKSAYFDNAVSRYMWAESALSLRSCESVSFLGYSLPVTDTALASLISEHLNPDAEVLIADLNPDRVADNLQALGVHASRIRRLSGTSAIADLVSDLTSRTQRRVATELKNYLSTSDDSPIALYWDRDVSASVLAVEVERDDGSLVLSAEPLSKFGHTNRSRQGQAAPLPLTARALAAEIEDASQLFVRDGSGVVWPIVDFGRTPEWAPAGHSSKWLALKGAGKVDVLGPPEGKPFDLRRQPAIYSGAEEPPPDAPDGTVWLRT